MIVSTFAVPGIRGWIDDQRSGMTSLLPEVSGGTGIVGPPGPGPGVPGGILM